jgi:hypothetical protein
MSLAVQRPIPTSRSVHCELDNWDFDPRYTAGVCPICGWQPGAGLVAAEPTWITRLRSTEWDVISLIVLAIVLLVMAFFVGRAAGFHIDLRPA